MGEVQRKVGKFGQTSKIMHSRSLLTTFVIDSLFFCSVCSRDGNNSIEKMFLENLEKNLEKRIPP
jgi:hypothetical protein